VSSYAEFLAAKVAAAPAYGHTVEPEEVHPFLHPFQRDIVVWAVERGRAAIWTTTGTGKTVIQLEWARLSGRTSLIVAPLAVCFQTVREARDRLGLSVTYVRSGDDLNGPGLWITNYEMMDRFDPTMLDAVVLDEASILKNETGKTRTRLIKHFIGVPRRLACTATPAPNDSDELTSQAEFLGICSRTDMLATYFIHDEDGWRVKRHAREPMFRWMASWAIAMLKPSDLGYSDDGYQLPGLGIVADVVDANMAPPDGQLFASASDIGGVGGRARVRRETTAARVSRALEIIGAD